MQYNIVRVNGWGILYVVGGVCTRRLYYPILILYTILYIGISLSPFQIKKANEFTAQAGLSQLAEYTVADAMNMPFKDNQFDLSKFVLL